MNQVSLRTGGITVEGIPERDLRDAESDRLLLTLLFTDIVDSTRIAERLGDREWHALLIRHRTIVRQQLKIFRGQEIDCCGDGFLARVQAPGYAARCAWAIRSALEPIGLRSRSGIHAAECESVGGSVAGIAVHIVARIAAIARPGEVLVSSTVKDLAFGSELCFARRGRHTLKGLKGSWELFASLQQRGNTRSRGCAKLDAGQAIRFGPEGSFRLKVCR
jgi:class 3 adenylate cyclase